MILECAVDVEERRRGVKGERKYEVKLIDLFLRRCYPWFLETGVDNGPLDKAIIPVLMRTGTTSDLLNSALLSLVHQATTYCLVLNFAMVVVT